MKIRRFNIIFEILLLTVLSYWVLKPLLVKGYFPMHDDTQPARIFEMAQALKEGQFPVRWVGDLGYGAGYPLFNFYAPLPYYIGALVYLTGLNAIYTAKITFGIGIILSALLMYFFLKKIAGRTAGMVGSIMYLYAPYHAVNIYVRGALGELYAYSFIPLLALGIYQLFSYNTKQNVRRGVLWGTMGLSGMILSHNILGMLGLIFLLLFIALIYIYLLVKKLNLKIMLPLGLIGIFSLMLTSFFWMPAVFEKQYTNVESVVRGGSNFSDHFVYPDQLWNSAWGYAGSAPARADGMSFMIGKFHLILTVISLFLYLMFFKRKNNSYGNVFLISAALFILSTFMMLQSSRFIWLLIPFFKYIQFPWRFLNFSLFFLVLSILYLFTFLKENQKKTLSALVIIFSILFYAKFFQPAMYITSTDADYISAANLTGKMSAISDEYLPVKFIKKNGQEIIDSHNALSSINARVDIDRFTYKEIAINSPESGEYISPFTFFPGWEAILDGKKTSVKETFGRISLSVPDGESKLTLKFTDTPVRKIANTISIFGIFLLVYVALFRVKFPL
ncbi:hypothetical protein A3D03_02490 [Candidatus Gottesmanbacteria bacterium RIFCSPHIGHO2_02_FULL_40_13]|uniref:Membrane protein 6-pyruvoyl-tetrahydropterin synthase-related domain-containing protein n=1 Tax=Candidatus Gottesmanbacteria bacterium RIFCSPHIGHO2_02_FULL_40_13 TaxID=1798384 RepID=A0A1F6AA26_9BACT|nr:MAG: hypothetical protein A3D03_02490 [Candidatus Gottesmanbacteria bacterium RIFCSPHIGHO2_02_FULL_40_13]